MSTGAENAIIQRDSMTVREQVMDVINLGGNSVNRISYDYTDKSMDALATCKALHDAFTVLQNGLNTFNTTVETYSDNSSLSTNLMSTTMDDLVTDPDNGFDINLWVKSGSYRYLTNAISDYLNNYIKIPNSAITAAGMYFLMINVNVIINANIVIYDENNNILLTITEAGLHYIEINFPNVGVGSIKIVAEPISVTEPFEVVIKSCSLHHVTNRLYYYLLYSFDKMLQDFSSSGYVTADQMNMALESLGTSLENYVAQQIASFNTNLQGHLTATNPHGLNHTSVGAAAEDHSHTLVSLGAAAEDHNHTPESIGAADRIHTHTPEDIGAAAEDHNHDDRYLLRSENIIPKVLKSSIIIDAPTGILPNDYTYTKVNFPPAHLQSVFFNHTADGTIDLYSGIISSNKETIGELYHAVKHDMFAGFLVDVTNPFSTTILNYRFHIARAIGSITLNRDTVTYPAYPETIELYVNDILMSSETLVWDVDTCTISVDPVAFSNVTKLGIKVTSISSEDNWSINFIPNFIESTSLPFFIASGISVTYEQELVAAVSNTLSENLYFNIENMIVDHPYFVALIPDQTNPELSTIHVSDLPPEYGVVDDGTVPFLNNYTDSAVNDFYGTVTATSEDITHPVYNLYNDDYDSYMSEDGVTSIIIIHTFNEARTVKSIGIVFNKSEVDLIPSDLILNLTAVDGTMLQLSNITGYLPDINNDSSEYVTLTFEVDRAVTKFSLSLSGPIGNRIAVNLLKVALDTEFYNINKLIWEDNAQRNYIGIIYKRSHGYELRPYCIGNTVCMGINSLNPCVANTQYEIVNPFGSTNIDVELFSLNIGSYLVSPSAEIISVLNDKIIINVLIDGVYAIDLTREW